MMDVLASRLAALRGKVSRGARVGQHCRVALRHHINEQPELPHC